MASDPDAGTVLMLVVLGVAWALIRSRRRDRKDGLNKLPELGKTFRAAPQGGGAASARRLTKQCPFCAEEIKEEAIVCRFCHLDLSTGKPFSSSEKPQWVSEGVQSDEGTGDRTKQPGEKVPFSGPVEIIQDEPVTSEPKSVPPSIPGVETSIRYCPGCGNRVIAFRDKINHGAHLVGSLLTAGLWLIVWLLIVFSRGTEWTCPECRTKFK